MSNTDNKAAAERSAFKPPKKGGLPPELKWVLVGLAVIFGIGLVITLFAMLPYLPALFYSLF